MSISIANLLSPRTTITGTKRPASCMSADNFTPNKRSMLSTANHPADSKPFIASVIMAYPGLPIGLAPPPGLPVPVHLLVSVPAQVNSDDGIHSYQTPTGIGLGLGIVVPLSTISKSLGLYGESRRLPTGPVARWVYPYATAPPSVTLPKPAPTRSGPSSHPAETIQTSTPDALVRNLVQSFANWQVPLQPTHRTKPSMHLPIPSPRRDFSLLEPTWITPEEERLFDLGKDEAEVAHISLTVGACLYLEQNAEQTSLVAQGGTRMRNALTNFRTRFGGLFAGAEQ
ncbi:hypothetical protein BDV93DRAFT_169346 [Ceratobasidium sp. AG-I]|nr:hypothetical protein BDV93DRAFT_169346 [Ceratobasidium sp. AG-I]